MAATSVYSIVLALLTAVAAGMVGSFALMKRMSLAGDVMSHIALPGLGLALLFKINPLVGGAATLLLGTVLIWSIEQKGTLTTDVAIGVIFTAALAAGTILTPSEDLIEALFGGFQPLTLGWFLVGVAGVALVIIFLALQRHRLMLTILSPELAAAQGINVSLLDLSFLLIFSLTILLGLRSLGALLVGALIIVPAAVGRQIATGLTWFLTASSVAAVVSVAAGIIINLAYPHVRIGNMQLNLALGPAITSVAAILFLVSLAFKTGD
ncbi:MAG TPA: metal ABC transporter permease [Blastocatellia bacterium]|nr:metal ABC transporter permease [Blastocatellia bacterium]